MMLAFFPLFIIVALVVKLDGRGPIIFRQVRIGLDEKPFIMFKFRTMNVGAEEDHQELVAQQMSNGGSFLLHRPFDPRTTRVGRVLRKLSLDELPQFVNVVNGSMSLVGPRPMMPEEVDNLTTPQLRRFSIPPGITGWAQVNGRGSLGANRYIAHDLYYIDNYSPGLYWLILLRTPLSILNARGAA